MARRLADQSLCVLSDHRSSPLLTPDWPAFRDFGRIDTGSVNSLGRLPDADCLVLDLAQVDSRSAELILHAAGKKRRVAVVAGALAPDVATELRTAAVSVIPSFGTTGHLGQISAWRALRRVVRGRRVVAQGFLEHSAPGASPATGTVLKLIQQASAEALDGTRVLAAVLAPRRTGSQYLRDLIGWTAGAAVRVFHEHEVPDTPEPWSWDQSLQDLLLDEPDAARQRALRRHAIGSLVACAQRRYFFVPDREPKARIVSLFVKRHSLWLRSQFDMDAGAFRDRAGVQAAFDAWLPEAVRRFTRWHRRWLFATFGLDVTRAEPTADGLLVHTHQDNTLVVVPLERFEIVRAQVEARYGAGHCAILDEDSAASRGDAAVAQAVRRDLRFPEEAEAMLLGSPESAWIRAQVSGRVVS